MDRYPTTRFFTDVHSFSELILYPWGDDDNQSTAPAQNFANPAFDRRRGLVEITVFGPEGEGHLRMSYSIAIETLEEAARGLRGL